MDDTLLEPGEIRTAGDRGIRFCLFCEWKRNVMNASRQVSSQRRLSLMNKMFLLRLTLLACALFAPLAGRAQAPDPLPAAERAQLLAGFAADLKKWDAEIAADPRSVEAYSRRGDAQLFLGHFSAAVADFEKMIALDPAQDAPHWRVGIAYYFARQFTKSAKQFEKYHNYDGGDRENGIWRFLAQANSDGIEKARDEMLVYTHFDREPFPSLYEMFAGKKTPDDVLAEMTRKGLENDENALFFGRYYAGLDEELLGHHPRALELLNLAVAGPAKSGGAAALPYMWQVARVHFDALGTHEGK
jgi:lipoprotein NlpI